MAGAVAKPFHLGLTPEAIIDAAVALTRESNLFGWSIRDLARELAVTPSVIYHHVGGKDLLARGVAERVISAIELPPEGLEWREWFRRLLVRHIYPVTTAHPGVAKWLLMHGVPFPSAMGVFEIGIGKLRDAGFGSDAAFAYAAIMNTATLTVSMGDDRMLHEEDGPRDHAAMMADFTEAFAGNPRLAALGDDLIGPFADGGIAAAEMRERYFRYIVEVTLAGIAATAPIGDSAPES